MNPCQSQKMYQLIWVCEEPGAVSQVMETYTDVDLLKEGIFNFFGDWFVCDWDNSNSPPYKYAKSVKINTFSGDVEISRTTKKQFVSQCDLDSYRNYCLLIYSKDGSKIYIRKSCTKKVVDKSLDVISYETLTDLVCPV